MKKDLFAQKSKQWDLSSRRLQSAKSIANSIANTIKLTPDMHVMDFGAGTGLLSYCLSNSLKKITLIDNSPSMLKVFQEKEDEFLCLTEMINIDLTKESLHKESIYDGIVSSMTLHHIEDIKRLFQIFYTLLPKNGFIALADLDTEDGSFHSNNEGVYHFGFQRDKLKEIAIEVGFKELLFTTSNKINKPHSDFTIFLMTARK